MTFLHVRIVPNFRALTSRGEGFLLACYRLRGPVVGLYSRMITQPKTGIIA